MQRLRGNDRAVLIRAQPAPRSERDTKEMHGIDNWLGFEWKLRRGYAPRARMPMGIFCKLVADQCNNFCAAVDNENAAVTGRAQCLANKCVVLINKEGIDTAGESYFCAVVMQMRFDYLDIAVLVAQITYGHGAS
jgi:hypothetical protein